MAKHETAMFGAGCFWGVELEFSKSMGVISTEVGYSGGKKEFANPTYKDVCSDETGHAEVIKIVFDPKKISYEELLDVFWRVHDPTQINRQGVDIGTQYRSVIFYYDDKQREKAIKSIKEEQKKLGKEKKIATKIEKAHEFFRAEEYHQKYLEKRGLQSCRI